MPYQTCSFGQSLACLHFATVLNRELQPSDGPVPPAQMESIKMKFVIAAIAATAIASPAHAGWQYTEWGMTLEQVAAAAPGPVGPDVLPLNVTRNE
jgi:hypothetical protein